MSRRNRRRKSPSSQRRLSLESLESRTMLDATGVLSGIVFLDANGDDTRDAGEQGVPGVVITLSDSGVSADRSTITGDDGSYTFTELEAGTYEISKRQTQALVDGTDSTSVSGATASNNLIGNIVLADDDNLSGINFAEQGLQAEFVSIAWFFGSAPPVSEMLRETIARSEELGGDSALAASIRSGVGDGTNSVPVTAADAYTVAQGEVLSVDAASGVLANDTDPENDTLTAILAAQPASGAVTFSADGSFTYTPNQGFSGNDSFTYQADDGVVSSDVVTVSITVTSSLFAAVVPGSFDEPGLLGIRADQVAGAPAITSTHRTGDIDYSAYTNPPTYGDHGSPPVQTGIFTTEQAEENLLHNLEHGHVWISYDPNLISADDLAALTALVQNGSPNANGGGVGVILTPRQDNDNMIALVSWARLLTLDSYDATTIRDFVETNRGHSPEGFIAP